MTTFVPPYPQAMIANYSGYGSGASPQAVNGNGSVSGSSSQVPEKHNLTWVAGDTAIFSGHNDDAFFFAGVCLTEVDPGLDPDRPDGITWTMATWQSQVRGSKPIYWGYWWPPLMPYGAFLMAFVVTAEFVEDHGTPEEPVAGTVVTLSGGTIWPGDWKWDLQTKYYPDPMDLEHYGVRTWKSGDVTVLPQVTMDPIVPPSHWPVYEYA